jgi:hypothetical protein
MRGWYESAAELFSTGSTLIVRLSLGSYREGELNRTPDSRCALDIQFAFHQVDQVAGDGEP